MCLVHPKSAHVAAAWRATPRPALQLSLLTLTTLALALTHLLTHTRPPQEPGGVVQPRRLLPAAGPARKGAAGRAGGTHARPQIRQGVCVGWALAPAPVPAFPLQPGGRSRGVPAGRQQAGSKRPGLLPTRLPRMRLLSCRAGLHAAHETIPIVPPHRTAPQAWYREGRAAEGLGRWEEAASAYFQASQLQVGSVLAGLGHARLTTPMRCCPAPASAWEGGVCAEPPLHALIL